MTIRQRSGNHEDGATRRVLRGRPTFYHHLHPPHIPLREARFRYTFGLGGISLLMLFVLLVTGLLEMFYYVPSLEEANSSLQQIKLLVPYGSVIRGLHYWAAQVLVVTSLLHLIRVALTGGYKGGRRFNWLLGLSLLVMVLFFDFTGYALRWDEEIAWALKVGTNLLRTIPLVGESLYGLVIGGEAIGRATVVRLYGWHVYGLVLASAIFTGWHLFRVRRDGGISRADRRGSTISRNELVRRETLAALIASIGLLILTVFFPPSLAPAANFESLPAEATAPWFFLWIQELLRRGPPLWMGVIIPLALLIALGLVPYVLDRSAEGIGLWFNRPGRLAQIVVLLIVAFTVALTLVGTLR
ncbi:MAG TPA: cytochrome b N-terminal domain-containing protein [Anaerolineae bacterium]|nr:cytochrome b N-terminal domain-containing protein [Anaerolineae bacterium]